MNIKQSKEDFIISIIVYPVLIILVLSILFPFWSLLIDSLSSPESVSKAGIKFFPEEITFASYQEVFQQRSIGTAYLNTIFRTVIGVLFCVIISFCAGYPLSKQKLPFKKTITILIIFTMFFGGGLIPTYLVIRGLGLLDTYAVLILPLLFNGFYILVMRNFLYSIPLELEESALLDGANEITICFKIFMPLSFPVIATITLFSAVMYWNEWFQAMIYTTDQAKIIMQLLLRRVLLENQLISMMAFEMEDFGTGKNLTEESVRAAIIFVAIGPIVLIYPFVQKFFITGIMTGAVKG